MDPVSAALCGAGAAVVLMGGIGDGSPMGLLVLGGAFYGMSRATRSRAVLGLMGALLVVWFLNHFWTFVPEKLLGTGFGQPNEKHHDAPAWWAEALMHVTLLASVFLVRSKIGWGLTSLTTAAMAIAGLARVGSAVDNGSVAGFFDPIASGWFSVIRGLVAAAWIIVGIGAPPPAAISRRVAPMLGAAGALLITATLAPAARGSDAAELAQMATMVVAWVLSAIGLGSLARAGAGTPAWVGMALVIAQLVLGFPVGLVVFDKMANEQFINVVAMSMPLGLAGFGIAALAGKALPLGAARAMIGVLFLVAAFGALLTVFTVLVHSRLHDPFWPLSSLMRPATVLGMSLWAAYLGFVALPPKATTT